MSIITVGTDAGIIRTDTNEGIQIAVDTLAYRGGGTVKVLAGTYTFKGPLRLRANVTVKGAGPDLTVFRRGPAVTSELAEDADIGQKEVHPVSTEGFSAGTGFILRSKTVSADTMPHTVSRVRAGVIYIDAFNTLDVLAESGGMIMNYFQLIHGFEVDNAAVQDLTLDGAAENDAAWRHNVWGGNLYLRRCNNTKIRSIRSVNAHGDGIRCGQSRGTLIQGCEMAYNTHYGVHPGSHSPDTVIEQCHVHHNGSDGVYLCWGVKRGQVLNNIIHHNGLWLYRNGISTGHKDTDTLFAGNHIYENAKHGIHIRRKTGANGAHRTEIRNNIVENNGWAKKDVPEPYQKLPALELKGHGIYVSGITRDVVIEDNIIRDTRKGAERLQVNGVHVEPGVTGLKMKGNKITGHPVKKVSDGARDKSNKLQK